MISNVGAIIDVCKKYKLNNLFDIGSRDGDDANYLSSALNINQVYVFEPNPSQFKKILNSYPNFKTFNYAISNFDGKSNFFCIRDNFDETIKGISSLKNRIDDFYNNKADIIEVEVFKFSTFIKQNKIENIDLVKIDVEGCTFEVLEGFEEYLQKIKIIHLEAENKIYWEQQKLYSDIKLLLDNNFKQVYIQEYDSKQLDSIWVNKNI